MRSSLKIMGKQRKRVSEVPSLFSLFSFVFFLLFLSLVSWFSLIGRDRPGGFIQGLLVPDSYVRVCVSRLRFFALVFGVLLIMYV